MTKDPFNVVVAGVGGQGNVVASLLIGSVLVDIGYKVTIGETYGASQRGGSVMSHLRISSARQLGPLIPPRCANLVIALEPSEAVRVLGQFGNRETVSIVNTRPLHPVDVISGLMPYPPLEQMVKRIESLSKTAYLLPATEKALELGSPVLANIILIGAAAGSGLLPIDEDRLGKAVRDFMAPDKEEINRKAFLLGRDLIQNPSSCS